MSTYDAMFHETFQKRILMPEKEGRGGQLDNQNVNHTQGDEGHKYHLKVLLD